MKKYLSLKKISFLIVGNVALAFGTANFILPYGLVAGGTSGIAIILNGAFNWNQQLIINIVLITMFILGTLFLGKLFAIQTIFSTIFFPFALDFFMRHPLKVDTENTLLIALYAGLITGIGIGLVFNIGASTGGTDIPPLIINKYTGIKLSVLVALTDGAIILLGVFVTGVESVMLGLVAATVASMVVNKLLVLGSASMLNVMIISTQHDRIVEWIHQEIERGTTLLDAKGGYTSEGKPVIMTVIEKRTMSKVHDGIQKIDPEAFIITHEVNEVRGRGFTFK